jgi:hypothetical protein
MKGSFLKRGKFPVVLPGKSNHDEPLCQIGGKFPVVLPGIWDNVMG